MQRRGQCKFFARGTCLKGEFCDYIHDMKMKSQTGVCMHYQRGTCSYGGRCKFEHAKSSWAGSCGPSVVGTSQNPSVCAVLSDQTRKYVPPVTPEILICALAVDGNCPHGESCSDIHGDLCATCLKYCLHPSKPEAREKHIEECEKEQALERSQDVECSVCLERVLSKTEVGERKFGLLSECDHPFCISCIMKWRSVSSSSEMEVNSASRACPVCRKLSYYVIPSIIWYSSKEEKQDIIKTYKAKLKSIDCRYFDFGNGRCRHGSKCFYKHKVKPGSSQHNPSSSSRYKHKNRQYMGRWDDDDADDLLGFEEFADMEELDGMLEMFGNLFFFDDEEPGDGEQEEDPLGLFSSFKKALKLQLMLTGDYEEEDFLAPWQKEFMYSQMGYDDTDYDDYVDYDDIDYGFGDISDEEG